MGNKQAVKNYCYASCGPVVVTGFHHEQYKVCKSCKQEISDALYERIKSNEKAQDEPKKGDKKDDGKGDDTTWWGF